MVFLSYATPNRAIADAICAAIERTGVRCWMAPRDVTPGQHYAEAIVDAINASGLVVVILSADSNRSEQVLREVERAASKGVPIVTFRIEDVLPEKALEYFLSSQHWVDARTPPIESHASQLADVVARMAKVDFSPAGVTNHSPGRAPWSHRRTTVSRRALVLSVGAAAAATGGIGWWLRTRDLVPMDLAAVAVLPFENETGDVALGYLCHSVPDELDALLTNMSAVVVRPFDAVRKFVADKEHLRDVGTALGVGHFVGGTFSRAPDGLTLAVSITDSIHQRQVWSQKLHADLARPSDTVQQMVSSVGSVLQLRLEAGAVRESLGTADDRAYDLYLRAIGLEVEINQERYAAAIPLLESAVAIDPSFARAWAVLAESLVTTYYWNLSQGADLLDRAEIAARRAMELKPDLAESHFAMAVTFEGKGLRADAIRKYIDAYRSNKHHAKSVATVARFLFYMASFDRSLAMWDAFARLDVTSNTPRIRRAMCHFFKGSHAKASAENTQAERFARGVDELTLVAFVWAWLKDFAAAKRVLARFESESPAAGQLAEIRAWIFTMQGRTTDARAQMKIMEQASDAYGIQDELATLYAIQGDREEAITRLTRAVVAGAPNLAWYRSDFFKCLRGDARYESVLAALDAEYAPILKALPK